MNRSYFSKAKYMIGVGFKKLQQTTNTGLPTAHVQGCQAIILLKHCVSCQDLYLKSVDPDKMLRYMAPHPGLLPFAKLPVQGFPVYKGLRTKNSTLISQLTIYSTL